MKKWVALAVFATLLLTSVPAFANNNPHKGPAEKATGTFGISQRGWYAEFNAHEATDGRPEKGSMKMWSDVVDRELHLEVSKVNVVGDEAEFEALCTDDSSTTDNREGRTLYVKVKDNGEPGISADEIGWLWDSPPDTYNKGTIIDGNLQVHNYYPDLVDIVEVNANDPDPIYSNIPLESGVQYELEAMGTAYAGGKYPTDIEFDAKYSITHSKSGDTWTDIVTGYESYGTTLLDLFVDGVPVDWGAYNPEHTYYWTLTGAAAKVELKIYDIFYPNNTGFIKVNIYRLP